MGADYCRQSQRAIPRFAGRSDHVGLWCLGGHGGLRRRSNGRPHHAHYAAAKAGLINLTKSAARTGPSRPRELRRAGHDFDRNGTADGNGFATRLNVSYTISGGTAAAFNIDIDTSPDGTTVGQSLTSVSIDGSTDYPLAAGTYTASFTPTFNDVQSDYHLIAVANATGIASTVEFDGGIFYAENTAISPQDFLYVFGTPNGNGDTVILHGNSNPTSPNTVVFDGGTPFSIDPSVTGIHVRGEDADGADTFQADADVSLPLWLFGGDGVNTLVGGVGDNLIVGGSGQNSVFNDGVTTPQIVDTSDTLATNSSLVNYYQESGTWGADANGGSAYNDQQRLHEAETGTTDTASWTFANLDSSPYYEVYATWSAEAGASTAAQYTVSDDGTTVQPFGETSTPTVNQNACTTDLQAAGVYWQEIGVFQANSDTLTVSLFASATSPVLANAVMIVPVETPPVTSLSMDSFTVDNQGNLSVSYTINGEDAAPFSIGIYQSADGVHPGALVGTIDVSDPADLTGGGTTHTVIYQDGLDGGQYYLAKLDCDGQIEQIAGGASLSAPLTGVYQDSDGSLYTLLGTDSASHALTFSQDTSGNVTVNLNGTSTTYENVTAIYVTASQGACDIDASGISLPLTVYCGSGDNTVIGGHGNNEIYGGSGSDVLDGSNGQNNWIQAGSGNATTTGGSGNDWLYGGSGTNTITGGPGTEKIYGGSGTNYLTGGSGLDNIIGGSGTNYIYGHGENDLLAGGSGSNYIQPNSAYPTNNLAQR